jgi:hypothetical protein
MKKFLPWLIIGAVVLTAAVVVSLMLTGDDAPRAEPRDPETYDLSSPERAAEAFAAAAASGDGQALLSLTCVAEPKCVAAQQVDQVRQAKQLIVASVADLATQLDGARFTAATEALVPGAMEVGYRTPGMPTGERRALMFVELDGRWLYVGSAGRAAPTT